MRGLFISCYSCTLELIKSRLAQRPCNPLCLDEPTERLWRRSGSCSKDSCERKDVWDTTCTTNRRSHLSADYGNELKGWQPAAGSNPAQPVSTVDASMYVSISKFEAACANESSLCKDPSAGQVGPQTILQVLACFAPHSGYHWYFIQPGLTSLAQTEPITLLEPLTINNIAQLSNPLHSAWQFYMQAATCCDGNQHHHRLLISTTMPVRKCIECIDSCIGQWCPSELNILQGHEHIRPSLEEMQLSALGGLCLLVRRPA